MKHLGLFVNDLCTICRRNMAAVWKVYGAIVGVRESLMDVR